MTLHQQTHRAHQNAALKLTRQYLTAYPQSTVPRLKVERAALKIIQREALRHDA